MRPSIAALTGLGAGSGICGMTFVRPKACKSPHSLQPIVRPTVTAGLLRSYVRLRISSRSERSFLISVSRLVPLPGLFIDTQDLAGGGQAHASAA